MSSSVTTVAETMKFTMVTMVALPIEALSELKRNPVPLSKSMTISVMVVNTLPKLPKFSGVANDRIGPMRIPMIIKISTVGIFVYSKRLLHRWAKKMSEPMKIIALVIDIIYWL